VPDFLASRWGRREGALIRTFSLDGERTGNWIAYLFQERTMASKSERDVEKVYSNAEYVAKLRRLADAIESGERFEIQIAGKRIYVPARAEFSVEHEVSSKEEEIEFQIKWQRE
jgi:amphi-Trp domain-containing protein